MKTITIIDNGFNFTADITDDQAFEVIHLLLENFAPPPNTKKIKKIRVYGLDPDSKIEAIKLHRELTSCSLKEAKDIVELINNVIYQDYPFSQTTYDRLGEYYSRVDIIEE